MRPMIPEIEPDFPRRLLCERIGRLARLGPGTCAIHAPAFRSSPCTQTIPEDGGCQGGTAAIFRANEENRWHERLRLFFIPDWPTPVSTNGGLDSPRPPFQIRIVARQSHRDCRCFPGTARDLRKQIRQVCAAFAMALPGLARLPAVVLPGVRRRVRESVTESVYGRIVMLSTSI